MIGLEPTAADARFVASIGMVDGVPKVTWSPDLGVERVYRVLGAKGLGDAAGETHCGVSLLCCFMSAAFRLEDSQIMNLLLSRNARV